MKTLTVIATIAPSRQYASEDTWQEPRELLVDPATEDCTPAGLYMKLAPIVAHEGHALVQIKVVN